MVPIDSPWVVLFSFHWPRHHICHCMWNIWRVILMTLKTLN